MDSDNIWLKVRIIGLFQKIWRPQEELLAPFQCGTKTTEKGWRTIGDFRVPHQWFTNHKATNEHLF